MGDNSTLAARLWAKVDRSGDCWNWTGTRFGNGYGDIHIWRDGKWTHGLAHRVMYELVHGPIPAGMNVLHSCDNRRCVRPDHLHLGSQSENIREMDARGRRNTTTYARGEQSGNAKLTDEDVRVIRAVYTGRYGEPSILARRYNVSVQVINAVLSGKTWTHVTGTPHEPPAPLRRPRGWDHYPDGCVVCGQTDSKHTARGVCQRCYMREKMAAKRIAWRAAGRDSHGKLRSS